MNCPKCGASNLRSIVHVIIDRPAGNIGVNKKTINTADVVILGVDWPNENILCYQCGYNEFPSKPINNFTGPLQN